MWFAGLTVEKISTYQARISKLEQSNATNIVLELFHSNNEALNVIKIRITTQEAFTTPISVVLLFSILFQN